MVIGKSVPDPILKCYFNATHPLAVLINLENKQADFQHSCNRLKTFRFLSCLCLEAVLQVASVEQHKTSVLKGIKTIICYQMPEIASGHQDLIMSCTLNSSEIETFSSLSALFYGNFRCKIFFFCKFHVARVSSNIVRLRRYCFG